MSYLSSLNSILSTTTSRYTSLRRQLLSSSSEDDSQVDDPDSSHVSKVLRAYYTEKGRPLPPWLPPDPKSREQQTQVQGSFASSAGSLRGSGGRPNSGGVGQAGGPTRGGGVGLGDLWADNLKPAAQPPPQNTSLRRGLGGARLGFGARARTQDTHGQEDSSPLPLPSQRAGSYQSAISGNPGIEGGRGPSPVPPGSSGSTGGGSVQERLKARLGKGGGTPPALGRESSAGSGSGYVDSGGYAGSGGGEYASGGGSGYGENRYGDGGQGYDVARKPLRQGGVGLPSGPRQR